PRFAERESRTDTTFCSMYLPVAPSASGKRRSFPSGRGAARVPEGRSCTWQSKNWSKGVREAVAVSNTRGFAAGRGAAGVFGGGVSASQSKDWNFVSSCSTSVALTLQAHG